MSEILIQSIMGLINSSDGSKITEELVTTILQQLENFKVDIVEADCYIVAYAITKVESKINNILNTSEMPKEVNNIFVNRVCGEVLYTKYIRDELPENFNEVTVVKQMSLGDTNVTYDTSQSENKLLTLLETLKRAGEGELLCYRKLTW